MRRNINEPLPNWVITNTRPAFYDTESLTVIEAIGRLYGKIKEFEKIIEEQNETIDEAYKYLKDNIKDTVANKVNEMIINGEIKVGVVYNDEEEELDILVTNGGEENE